MIILIFLAAAAFLLLDKFGAGKVESSSFISPLPQFSPTPTPTPTALSLAIGEALSGTHGSYGIAIKNLKTGESYFANEHKVYTAGSLYKLWVMAIAEKRIQEGTLSEDEILSGDIQALNREFNIDDEFADLTTGSINISVKNAITQMITISHNYAAMLLTKRINPASIPVFLSDNGFLESKAQVNGNLPTITPFDAALFFEKLYKGELANPEYTLRMIEILKKQQLNDKLPKYLPKNIEIAHKTGEIESLSHDVGIVYLPKGDYIIAVLSDSDSPALAEGRISLTSKAVFDYFSEKN